MKRFAKAAIYGIMVGEKIVYVGQTVKGIGCRFKEHLESAVNGDRQKIYGFLRSLGSSKEEIKRKVFVIQILMELF